jgi:hypothetical protein
MNRALLRTLVGLVSFAMAAVGTLIMSPAQAATVMITATISADGSVGSGNARLVAYEYKPDFSRWDQIADGSTDGAGQASVYVEAGGEYRFCFQPQDMYLKAPCEGGPDVLHATTITVNGSMDLGTVNLEQKSILDVSSVRITGRPVVGQVLSINTSGLPGGIIGIMTNWFRDGVVDAGSGQVVGGLLGQGYNYRVRAEDLGHMISLNFEASTLDAISTMAFPPPIFKANVPSSVGPVVLPMGFSDVPKMSVRKWKKGRVVSYVAPADTPAGATASFQWMRAGKAIKGATGAKYKIKKQDKRKRISLVVTYTYAGHETTVLETVRSPKIK